MDAWVACVRKARTPFPLWQECGHLLAQRVNRRRSYGVEDHPPVGVYQDLCVRRADLVGARRLLPRIQCPQEVRALRLPPEEGEIGLPVIGIDTQDEPSQAPRAKLLLDL